MRPLLPPAERWKYLKAALYHPFHIVYMAGGLVFGVSTWSMFVFLYVFVMIELVCLAGILCTPFIYEYVDERERDDLELQVRIAEAERLDEHEQAKSDWSIRYHQWQYLRYLQWLAEQDPEAITLEPVNPSTLQI